MAETFINLTEGSGKKAHAWDRTIGANTVLDEFVLPGEYPLATYTVIATAISIATVNDHVVQIMAGASLNVRIRRIKIHQRGLTSGVTMGAFDLYRLTTAGTGGSSITPAKRNNADSAAGATAMSLPSSKGTEGVQVDRLDLAIIQTAPITTGPVLWEQHPSTEPLIIPAGTSNGLAIKSVVAAATATVDVVVEIVETSFV